MIQINMGILYAAYDKFLFLFPFLPSNISTQIEKSCKPCKTINS